MWICIVFHLRVCSKTLKSIKHAFSSSVIRCFGIVPTKLFTIALYFQYFILCSAIDRLQFSQRVIMFLAIQTCANVFRFACICTELCEYFPIFFFSEICVWTPNQLFFCMPVTKSKQKEIWYILPNKCEINKPIESYFGWSTKIVGFLF